jgi:hypothetical protein
MADVMCAASGTQFTCFAGTKGQILTQKCVLLRDICFCGSADVCVYPKTPHLMQLLLTQYVLNFLSF